MAELRRSEACETCPWRPSSDRPAPSPAPQALGRPQVLPSIHHLSFSLEVPLAFSTPPINRRLGSSSQGSVNWSNTADSASRAKDGNGANDPKVPKEQPKAGEKKKNGRWDDDESEGDKPPDYPPGIMKVFHPLHTTRGTADQPSLGDPRSPA